MAARAWTLDSSTAKMQFGAARLIANSLSCLFQMQMRHCSGKMKCQEIGFFKEDDSAVGERNKLKRESGHQSNCLLSSLGQADNNA